MNAISENVFLSHRTAIELFYYSLEVAETFIISILSSKQIYKISS